MSVARYKTAGQVILSAGRELGLGTVADPYSSPDDNWIQLTQMLNSIGRELADTYLWENLVREYTFSTVAAQSAYTFPADYLAAVDDTFWDRTSRQPLLGPINAQEWQSLLASPLTTTPTLRFRLSQNQILLAPVNAVVNGHTIAFEIKSLAWANTAAQGVGTGNTLGTSGNDECVATGDVPLFDPLVLHYALKLFWRKNKGLDTGVNEADFIRALENAKGRARGARTLLVGGSRTSNFINARNLPWP